MRPPSIAGVRTPHDEKSRDRVLTDEELRAVWNAADTAGVFGSILNLLILTGQRRSEVTEMEWAELNFDIGFVDAATRAGEERPPA